MQRVLFIFDIVFFSSLGLWVAFIGFPWMANRLAPGIVTKEVAVMLVESETGFSAPFTLKLTEEELEEMVWCRHLDYDGLGKVSND